MDPIRVRHATRFSARRGTRLPGPAVVIAAAVSALSLLTPLMTGIASASTHLQRATQIKLPSNAEPNSDGFLFGVGCARAGSCVAGGSYKDTSGNGQAMVAVESAGRWRRALEVRLPPNAESNPFAEINSISCTAVGFCVAVGYYNGDTHFQGFRVTESHGTWARARPLAPPSDSAASSDFQINSVACTNRGFCVAVGNYIDSSDHIQAMVATESHGIWQPSRKLRLPANAGPDPGAFFLSVFCVRTGSCLTVGDYADSAGADQGTAVTESGGRWRRGVEIKLPAGTAANPEVDMDSVSCTGPGSCVAVGSYHRSSAIVRPMVATEPGGMWGRARNLTAVPSNAAAHPESFFLSVACAASGSCLAVGSYRDKQGGFPAMAAVRTGSRWRATEILPPGNAALGASMSAGLRSVACTRAGYCAAVGSYLSARGHTRPMAIAPLK